MKIPLIIAFKIGLRLELRLGTLLLMNQYYLIEQFSSIIYSIIPVRCSKEPNMSGQLVWDKDP